MSGINKVILVGRLGADPETKTLDGGNTVTNMSVATSESWTDKAGEKQEKTEWHRLVAFGKLAEICGQFLSKGRQGYFEGRLQTRSWDDEQGNKKYSTEIVLNNVQFLGDKTDTEVDRPAAMTTAGVKNHAPTSFPKVGEEMPF